MSMWDSSKVESANSFYWKTVLHKLYDRVVPYHPLMRHDLLDHAEKLDEIEIWLNVFKEEAMRIKKNRHLLLGVQNASTNSRWERGASITLPEEDEIIVRGNDGREIDVPLFVPYEKKTKRRRRTERAVLARSL